MNLQQSGPFIAVGGMATALFLYGYTAIVIPGLLMSVVLPVTWSLLFLVTLRWFSRRPYAVLAMPFAALALWFTVMLL